MSSAQVNRQSELPEVLPLIRYAPKRSNHGIARLKFTPERARWVKREEWHPDQKSTDEPDGAYILEFPYSDERELVGDILKHGPDVEVLAPPSLKKAVTDAILKMKKKYD
jgi:predicted DNA-binding transcriptional regulator YafY